MRHVLIGMEQTKSVTGGKIRGVFRNGNWAKSPLLAKNARNGAPETRLEELLLERLDRGGFVVFHVEDGVELGDLKQVVDLLGEVQQLQFAALILGGGEGADQFTDARAVDVVDVLQVQNNLLVALGRAGRAPCRAE